MAEPPSLPLSAVRTEVLQRYFPRLATGGRSMRALQLSLIQLLIADSLLEPSLLEAMMCDAAAMPRERLSTQDEAATTIQARARTFLIQIRRHPLRTLRRKLLRRAFRQLRKREDLDVVVRVRQNFSLMSWIGTIFLLIACGSRFSDMGRAMTPAAMVLAMAVILSLLLWSLVQLRYPACSSRSSEWWGTGLVGLSMNACMGLHLLLARGVSAESCEAVTFSPGRAQKAFCYSILLGVMDASWCVRLLVLVPMCVLYALAARETKEWFDAVMGPILLATCCFGASFVKSRTLQDASTFETTIGDLRKVLNSRRAPQVQRTTLIVERAWREGPLLRIFLLTTQIFVIWHAFLNSVGIEVNTSANMMGQDASVRARRVATLSVRLLFIGVLPQQWKLRWGYFATAGLLFITLRPAVRCIIGILASSFQYTTDEGLWGSLTLSEWLEGTPHGLHLPTFVPPYFYALFLDFPSFSSLVSTLLFGFMIATAPVPRAFRPILVSCWMCTRGVICMSGNLDVAQVEQELTRMACTLLGVTIAYMHVHHVLAAAWQRQRVVSELEVCRQNQLQRQATRKLRNCIARANEEEEEDDEPEPAACETANDDDVDEPPEWVEQLAMTPAGRVLLHGLLLRNGKGEGASRRSKRSRGSGRARSVSSQSSVMSSLAAISEEMPLVVEERESFLGVTPEREPPSLERCSSSHLNASKVTGNDFILDDESRFFIDENGFLVPKE